MPQPERDQLIADVISELKARYHIVPKSHVHIWGVALLLVLAGLGITSLIGFRTVVVGIAGAAARTTATETAITVAKDTATNESARIVQSVFHVAIESARDTAQIAAVAVAGDTVKLEAARAAKAAVQDWTGETIGKDVLDALTRADKESQDIVKQLRTAKDKAERETIEGLAARLDRLQQETDDLPTLRNKVEWLRHDAGLLAISCFTLADIHLQPGSQPTHYLERVKEHTNSMYGQGGYFTNTVIRLRTPEGIRP